MNIYQKDAKDWFLDNDPLSFVSTEIIDFISRRAGKKILDFGCGVGGYSARLTQLGFDCTAADINPDFLNRAKGLGLKTSLIKENKLDFPDNYFDTAIAIEVMEHLENPAVAIKEMKRVAKNNIIITVPNCTPLIKLSVGRITLDHMTFMQTPAVDHINFFTTSSLQELLKKEFPIVKIYEKEPIDDQAIHLFAPKLLALFIELLHITHILKRKFFYRLYAEAKKK